MALCTITGTVYDANGAVESGATLTVRPLGASAILLHNASFPATSNASGVVSFVVIQGAQYNIKGNVLGFTGSGLTVTIPAASSATLESLTASSLVPATGLTIKDEGTALASLIGTINVTGAGASVVQASAGVATLNVPGISASAIDDLSDVTITSVANDDLLQRKAGAWVNRTIAQLKADLSLSGTNTGDQDLSGYSLTSHNHTGIYEPLLGFTPAPATPSVNAQTGTTYSLQASDNGKIVTLNNAAAITVTVPSGLGAGFNCLLIQLGAGQVSFTASGTTINNRQGHGKLAGQHGAVSLVAYAVNIFTLAGDTSA